MCISFRSECGVDGSWDRGRGVSTGVVVCTLYSVINPVPSRGHRYRRRHRDSHDPISRAL